jgi:hypothetical protein
MALKCKEFIYKKHALERMLSRNIDFDEIESAIIDGEIIKEYPEDKPFQSYLILAYVNGKALHVVTSKDNDGNCVIISAYEPDEEIWNKDLKTKKK